MISAVISMYIIGMGFEFITELFLREGNVQIAYVVWWPIVAVRGLWRGFWQVWNDSCN